MFDSIKAFFQSPTPPLKVISITSSVNYAEVPQGFFRVEAASGKSSLGYNCPVFLCWDVGPTVVVGRERVTLSVPREELPLVKLNFKSPAAGVQQVGSAGVIDTDSLDGVDGSVGYDGVNAPRGDGFDFI
jgi:hypothetical protein